MMTVSHSDALFDPTQWRIEDGCFDLIRRTVSGRIHQQELASKG